MSTDGGATWTQTLVVNEDTGVSDIAIDPQSPNILYAAAYQHRRTVFGYNGGGPGQRPLPLHRRRRCTGPNWWRRRTLGRGLPPTGDMGRCALERLPQEYQHRLRAGRARHARRRLPLRRQRRHLDAHERHQSAAVVLQPDPRRSEQRSENLAGRRQHLHVRRRRTTFVQTRFRDVHSDVHAIWIDPANSDHLLSGNDGGIWVTWDSGRNWRAHQQHRAGPVLRGRVRFPEALSRLRRATGQLLVVRAQFVDAADAASATRTGSRCRAATASTTASTREIPISSTPNRRTAIFRGAICGPANRNRSGRWKTSDHGAALPLPVELADDDFAARSQDHLLRRQSPVQIDRPRRHVDGAGRRPDHQCRPRQDGDDGQDHGSRERRAVARRRRECVAVHHRHRRIAREGGRAVGGHRRRQRTDVARRRQDVAERGVAHQRGAQGRLREPHRAIAQGAGHRVHHVRQSPQRRLWNLHLYDQELRRFLHAHYRTAFRPRPARCT